MKKLKNKKKDKDNRALEDFVLTELYGKTAVDYVNSVEYKQLQQEQIALDEEFLDDVQSIDADCQDARDAFFKAYGLLEKKKINSQSASHRDTNYRIENLAKRELAMMELLDKMIEENENWLKEVL